MTHKLRYGIPFYNVKKWLCYISPQKKGGIELCFLHGRWMTDTQGSLDAKDRTQIYGITYHKLEEINEELLKILLKEAIEIDEKFSLY